MPKKIARFCITLMLLLMTGCAAQSPAPAAPPQKCILIYSDRNGLRIEQWLPDANGNVQHRIFYRPLT